MDENYFLMKTKLKFSSRLKKEIFKGYLLIYYSIEVKLLKFFLFFFRKKINDKKNKISLLCPSKNRSAKFKRLCNSLLKNTDSPTRVELLLCFDLIENEIHNYEIQISLLENKGFVVKKYFKNLNSHAKRNNFIADQSEGEIIFPVNDDLIILTSKWDNIIDKEFSKNNSSNPLCVWIKCDRKYKNLDYSAFPVINTAWYNRLGYIVPEYFKFWYLDWWICEVSRLSKHYFLSNVSIHQFHAETYHNEKDSVYMQNATSENLEHDYNMWLKTRNYRIKDSLKIKSKIKLL